MDEYITKSADWQEWRDLHDRCIEGVLMLPDKAPDEARHVEERSERTEVFRALLKEAEKQAKGKSLGPRAQETLDLFEHACDIAGDLVSGIFFLIPRRDAAMKLDRENAVRAFSMTLQVDPQLLDYVIKEKGARHLDKAEMENGIGRYIQGPFRSSYVDRLLLIALTDMEIEAYLAETIRPNILQKKSNYELAQISQLSAWVRGRMRSFVTTIILIAAAFAITLIWPNLPNWIPIGIAVLALGDFVLSAVYFGFVGITSAQQWNTTRKKTIAIVDGMRAFFAEFRTAGPISVPYFRKRLEGLAAVGVVWPVPIWALLDDIEKRGVSSV